MKKKMIGILLAGVILTAISLYMGRQQKVSSIDRNSYGEGTKTEEFQLYVDGKALDEKLQVEAFERTYTDEELNTAFEEVMKKLDTVILGENESFDRVEKDLNLVAEVEGYPILIQWQLDSYEVLGIDGQIQKENTVEEGTLVELRGILSYGEREVMYVRTVNIYPETKTGDAAVLEEITKVFKKEEEQTRKDAAISLPEEIDGKEILWEKPADRSGYMLLLLSVVAAFMLPALNKQKEQEKKKKRNEQMLTDYPKVIANFTLLLETGMTVKNVWTKIVKQYEASMGRMGQREVYREMQETYYEILGKVPEAEAYERFGQRCGLSEYRKFAALLSQNLRKGTKGISQLLAMESLQATENRKIRAKRKAEEAGTKLLMPMFVMLCIVIVIIIVPAFMSMSL